MSGKLHIAFLLTILSFIALPVFAQDTKVCMGSQEIFKASSKETGSTYDYEIPKTGGELLKQYNDSTIAIQWGQTKGQFQLGVRETSVYGCEGNWAYLTVEVVGDSAVFSQSKYSMCGGGGVYVEFDKSKFRSYEWDDKVNVDINTGYISKAGRYTISTIDQNECHLSSTIEVIQSTAMPKVHLGADTMICTPGFRLYALGISGNPIGTVYTWSTGESGVSAKFIDVDMHDLDQDQKYWVTAEFEGCSATDEIVVLACKTEPVPEALKIPNTFTPNDDGENDVWNISALRDYTNCVVEVFDRWGRKVFTSTKGYISNPWNGRDAKGHYLPMETYYYIIHLNDGKTNKPILGTITIIR